MNISVFVFLAAFVAIVNAESTCKVPDRFEEVDWARLRSIFWYDAVDIPSQPFLVDCFNWLDYVPNHHGVFLILEELILSNPLTPNVFVQDYKRVRPGIYRPDPVRAEEYYNVTYKALEHKGMGHEKLDTFLKQSAYVIHTWDWWFITDYKKFAVTLVCRYGKFQGFAKNIHPEFSGDEFLELRNLLLDHGISTKLQVKTGCIKENVQMYGKK
uniref:uncharacterized protein LOC120329388 n=1 Tax=Styela clava TaxID=7725 RepID=UPI0019392911|nr:uncharacterized protein LOC120329388 [Styela clava]